MTAQETLPQTAVTVPPGREVATLAGGCFWCTEAIVDALRGVDTVVPGYSGGRRPNPSYEAVCAGITGHAEAIQVVFDPSVLSYHDLLSVFFTIHDPSTLNRQGADTGTQYRSAVFTHGPEQEATARQVVEEIEKARIWPSRIVTEVTPFTNFCAAEPYHHDYFALHPEQGYCRIVIEPKVAKFREKYSHLMK
jgi:peptide-methionine (S)-S-oxide reductase